MAEPESNPAAFSLVPGAEPLAGYRLIDAPRQRGLRRGLEGRRPRRIPGRLEVRPPAGRRRRHRGAVAGGHQSHPPANLLNQFGAWQLGVWLIIGMELADRSLLDRLREAVARGLPGIPGPELLENMVEAAKGIDFLNEPRHPSDLLPREIGGRYGRLRVTGPSTRLAGPISPKIGLLFASDLALDLRRCSLRSLRIVDKTTAPA